MNGRSARGAARAIAGVLAVMFFCLALLVTQQAGVAQARDGQAAAIIAETATVAQAQGRPAAPLPELPPDDLPPPERGAAAQRPATCGLSAPAAPTLPAASAPCAPARGPPSPAI